MKSYKEIEKYAEVMTKTRIKCKCGKTTNITAQRDRVICDDCGHWVYRTPQLEFKYKMKQELKNARKQ